MRDRSRRPRSSPKGIHSSWIEKIIRIRRAHPSWGPKKIGAILRSAGRCRRQVPSLRTIARTLKRSGLAPERPKRARRGPVLPPRKFTRAEQPNDVWTIDFKGWFRTGGQRVEPLTVRDLWSRYILGIFLLINQSDPPARACLQRLFRRFGLPRVIRVDNGSPFGGKGALGLSRLSAWWISLGIEVEFSRPAHPEDNAGHEQMHRVYKRETASPPASSLARQQARTSGWVRTYNEERPHEALRFKVPGSLYERSLRPLGDARPSPLYPPDWPTRRVRNKGHIKWQGRLRFIGRAFVSQTIALRTLKAGVHKVYLFHHLIGHLHDEDAAGLRPAQHRLTVRKRSKR